MNTINKNKGIYSFLFNQLFTINHVNLGFCYLIFVFLVLFSMINIFNLLLNLNYTFSEFITYRWFFLIILYVFIPSTFFMMGNLFVPYLLNISNVAFPRLNNISFWLLAFSYLIALESMLNEIKIFSGEWVFFRLPYINSFLYYSFNRWEDLLVISLSFYCWSLLIQAINYWFTIVLNKKWNIFFNSKVPVFILTIMCGSYIVMLYVPTLLIVLYFQLCNLPLKTEIFNCFNIQNNFFLESNNLWFICYPLICIFIIIIWGSLNQLIFNIKTSSVCSKIVSKIIMLNSFLSIIFYYTNVLFLENIILKFYMEIGLGIFLTVSISVTNYLWLKKLNIHHLKSNLLPFFGIGCVLYYSTVVIMIIVLFLFKISVNFEALFNNLGFYFLILILIGPSFTIIGVVYRWLFDSQDYSNRLNKVLTISNFGFLIIGSFGIFSIITSNSFFDYPINNFLLFLSWLSILISFFIFLVILLKIFLSIQGRIFLQWVANSYMLFIESLYDKKEYPQTFINDSLITGAIFTRVFIWSYLSETISFKIKIVLIFFVPFLFPVLFSGFLLIPYRYIFVYFNRSRIGRLLNIFLSTYGDQVLIENFFVRLESER